MNFKKFSLPSVKTMLLAIVTYLSLIALLFFYQRELQYIPTGKAEKMPEGFVAENLITDDGIKILSWFRKPQQGQKVILYLHGNHGNIGDRFEIVSAFADSGFGVLAISYRGYFGSEGKPSEAGLIKDSEAAVKFLLDLGYGLQDIILFGESLGSGVAVQLAAKSNFAAVVLESPFSSIVSVAKKVYWFAPVDLIIKDRFDSEKFAPQITSPVLIFHGTADKVVSFAEGKKLFNAIKSPKKFIEIQGAGHLGLSGEFLAEEIASFVK